jgi:hypothetical protein
MFFEIVVVCRNEKSFCKFILSAFRDADTVGRCLSGRKERTVNPPCQAALVRIQPCPPSSSSRLAISVGTLGRPASVGANQTVNLASMTVGVQISPCPPVAYEGRGGFANR